MAWTKQTRKASLKRRARGSVSTSAARPNGAEFKVARKSAQARPHLRGSGFKHEQEVKDSEVDEMAQVEPVNDGNELPSALSAYFKILMMAQCSTLIPLFEDSDSGHTYIGQAPPSNSIDSDHTIEPSQNQGNLHGQDNGAGESDSKGARADERRVKDRANGRRNRRRKIRIHDDRTRWEKDQTRWDRR